MKARTDYSLLYKGAIKIKYENKALTGSSIKALIKRFKFK